MASDQDHLERKHLWERTPPVPDLMLASLADLRLPRGRLYITECLRGGETKQTYVSHKDDTHGHASNASYDRS
jgi:hypothetical protein